jgi:hypothetical protein
VEGRHDLTSEVMNEKEALWNKINLLKQTFLIISFCFLLCLFVSEVILESYVDKGETWIWSHWMIPSRVILTTREVSEQGTNGSKAAVIDVIGFLCVSLGSSTVQLHDSLDRRRACACPEADFSSQNGDRAWGVYYRRAAFCCAFFGTKGLNAKDIHKRNISYFYY